MEAVVNPSGRFRTLDGIFVLRNAAGDPIVTSTACNSINIDVMLNGRRYTLIFPGNLTENSERKMRLKTLASLTLGSLAASTYLEKEIYLFDMAGRGAWYDAVLQEAPEGRPIHEFAASCVITDNVAPLKLLQENFAALAVELHEARILHHNINQESIIVTNDMRSVLVGNHRVHIAEGDESTDVDNIGLALTGVMIYLATCRSDIFTALHTHCALCTLVGFRSVAPTLVEIAKRHDIAPLGELATLLFECRGVLKGRVRLNELLGQLAHIFKPEALAHFTLPAPEATAPVKAVNADCGHKYPVSDMLRCVMRGGKWLYLALGGYQAFDGEFDYAEDFSEGRAVVGLGNEFGLIDREGNIVMPIAFEEIRWFGVEGVAVASQDGKSTLYNRLGKRLTVKEWNWLGDLEDGMIAAELDGRFGYITPAGEEAVPFCFDNAYDFRHGRAIVVLTGKELVIDHCGEIVHT
ncbi:MAG: WG repeat-containing protein [Rikenellaceae bacterium]|nr:WG repeat-containing protein [Rikenellaceae bacterium]